MNKRIIVLLCVCICLGCKKETAKEMEPATPTTDSTDFREPYTGKFQITVNRHSSWYTGSTGIQTKDTSYLDTITISYHITDTAVIPRDGYRVPALRIAYTHDSYSSWYIYPDGKLGFDGGPGYVYGNTGGFKGTDIIDFTYTLTMATSFYKTTITGSRL